MQQLLWLALAGALGTLSRYAVTGVVQRLCGETFPWGTLAANCGGCLLFGLLWMLAEERLLISGEQRFIVLTGFMGAFTTFSTFAFETGVFLRDSEWLLAGANLIVQNVLGLAAVFAGLFLGRWL